MSEYISSIENTTAIISNDLAAFSSMGLAKALPPQFQMEKEIEAIKKNQDVQKALDGDEILEITKDDKDSIYYLRTENAILRVYIHYLPNEVCGPAKFEVEFLDKQEFKS